MRVRIKQNSQGSKAWYANRVGEVFDVAPYYHLGINTGDWVGHDFDGSGKDCLIAYEDAEELDEMRPKAGTENLAVTPSQPSKHFGHGP